MDHHQIRRDKLRKELRKLGADCLLVTNFINVTYLTGFTGDDSYLLVTLTDEILISDFRYTTQLEEECPGLNVKIRALNMPMLAAIEQVVKQVKPAHLAVEGESLTVGMFDRIEAKLGKVELIKLGGGLIERLRMVKDKEELTEIRRAISQMERALAVIRASIRPEQTEKEIADNLEHQMRQFGAKGPGFPSIVAVAERAALCHAQPTNRRVGEGDFILIDCGANSGLYTSDLTRVLVTGKISPKLERVYGVVLKAANRGIAAIRPGVACQDVDNAARSVIEDAGFGRYFGHGLGHGIGLEIHEAPRLGKNQTQLLEPGMVITVEPGIYLPGWGGIRIEDDILVTKTGHEVLTSVPKQWNEIHVGS